MEERERRSPRQRDIIGVFSAASTPWITTAVCVLMAVTTGKVDLSAWAGAGFLALHLFARLVLWLENRHAAYIIEWEERTSTEEEYAPCKHCKGDAATVFIEKAEVFMGRCKHCGLSAGLGSSIDEAVKSWNEVMGGFNDGKETD